MYATAEPIYTNLKKLRITKHPRYWVAYVRNHQNEILWSDIGFDTKKMALKFANMWISKKQIAK